MADIYKHRRRVRRSWYGKFRLRLWFVAALAIVLAVLGTLLMLDISKSDKSVPDTSTVQSITIQDKLNTFQTDYFSFRDSGNWVLNKSASTKTKFVYTKFSGVQPQHQLVIYVNETPIPLYLASSRVLPVRIVNDNALDVTNVYGPCGGTYGKNELHHVKVVTIEGANMLCDPDTPTYSAVLAEVGGNWKISLKRKNGSTANYVVTFRDQTREPGPDSIVRIAESFKSL